MIHKFAFFFATCFLLVLASCSGGEKTNGGTDAASTTPAATASPNSQPADAPGITGTYEMVVIEPDKATLQVDESGGKVSFHLSASVGNAAESDFTGNLEKKDDGSYQYPDDGCYIGFSFRAEGCSVKYISPAEGCGVGEGGVDIHGEYKKISNEKPAL